MIMGDKMLRYMLFRCTLQSNPNIKRGLKVFGLVFLKVRTRGAQISDAKSLRRQTFVQQRLIFVVSHYTTCFRSPF